MKINLDPLVSTIVIWIGLLLLVVLFSENAHAALCKTTTSTGQTAFLFKPDAKGKIAPTKTLSGTVAVLPECLVSQVVVERIVYEDYQAPNPINDCEKQAVLACDPAFNGLPIGNVGNMKGYCGFAFVTTKVNGEDTTLRYVNAAVYDGLTYAGYGKDNICRSPLDPSNVQ
ncbi:MAG TPA: hypothetical protein VES38_06870 [Methylotenera sp.]|nr:hypothetical protein [Methylotenera sp.]